VLRKLIGVAGLLTMGLVIAAAPGCGSSDEAAEKEKVDEDKYPDLGAFCNAVAQAECSAAVTGACAVNSKDTCIAKVQNSCSLGTSDITRGMVVSNYPYGKKDGEPCVKAITEAYADAKLDSAEHATVRNACSRVFTANRQAGFECTSDVDCASGLGCYFDGTGNAKGTCQKITNVAKADDCSSVGAVCEKGYYCAKAVTACIARKPAGAACKPFDTLCQENLLCTGVDSMTNTGTCTGKQAVGTDCTSDNDCDSDYCAQVGSKAICLGAFSLGTGAPACQNFGGT
jgi:hypothetical protein